MVFFLVRLFFCEYFVKMSDSDPDLAVERYDPEDNLNYYGSPMHVSPPHEIVGNVDGATTSANIQPDRIQVSIKLRSLYYS